MSAIGLIVTAVLFTVTVLGTFTPFTIIAMELALALEASIALSNVTTTDELTGMPVAKVAHLMGHPIQLPRLLPSVVPGLCHPFYIFAQTQPLQPSPASFAGLILVVS